MSASVAVMVCSLSENSKERKENTKNRTNYTLAKTTVFVNGGNSIISGVFFLVVMAVK